MNSNKSVIAEFSLLDTESQESESNILIMNYSNSSLILYIFRDDDISPISLSPVRKINSDDYLFYLNILDPNHTNNLNFDLYLYKSSDLPDNMICNPFNYSEIEHFKWENIELDNASEGEMITWLVEDDTTNDDYGNITFEYSGMYMVEVYYNCTEATCDIDDYLTTANPYKDAQARLKLDDYTLCYKYYCPIGENEPVGTLCNDQYGKPHSVSLTPESPNRTKIIPSTPTPYTEYGYIEINNRLIETVKLYVNSDTIDNVAYNDCMSEIDTELTQYEEDIYRFEATENEYLFEAKDKNTDITLVTADFTILPGNNTNPSVIWEISNDNTSPAFTLITPTDTTNVPYNINISIDFDESMNKKLTEDAFSLIKTDNGESISGNFSWDDAGDILTFDPISYLDPNNVEYKINLFSQACDLNGNKLDSDFEFIFTTSL